MEHQHTSSTWQVTRYNRFHWINFMSPWSYFLGKQSQSWVLIGSYLLILPRLKDITNFVLKLIINIYVCLSDLHMIVIFWDSTSNWVKKHIFSINKLIHILDVIVIEFLCLCRIVLFHKRDQVRSSKPLVIKSIVEVKAVSNLNRT